MHLLSSLVVSQIAWWSSHFSKGWLNYPQSGGITQISIAPPLTYLIKHSERFQWFQISVRAIGKSFYFLPSWIILLLFLVLLNLIYTVQSLPIFVQAHDLISETYISVPLKTYFCRTVLLPIGKVKTNIFPYWEKPFKSNLITSCLFCFWRTHLSKFFGSMLSHSSMTYNFLPSFS